MYYKGDIVRLLDQRDEPVVPKHTEGTVTGLHQDAKGRLVAADVRFFIDSKEIVVALPFAAIEPVVSGDRGCTAVFWGLSKSAKALIEDGMHALLDLLYQGFDLRSGLNVMQRIYDRQDRFWKKGKRFSDPSAHWAKTAGPEWDGCVVAFSGRQHFELDFRLRGRRPPYVLLHQRWEAYEEQSVRTSEAMVLLRVMTNLYEALGAQCCAIPVASNWLLDEGWDSLLREPYYPDFFIIPESRLPSSLPPVYRSQRLIGGQAILTTLPVKFAPGDDPIERTERELKLNQLRSCKAIGEKAYDQIYEAHGSITGLYSDAKEAFYDAIRIASELGLSEEVEELEKRLEHIKAVVRSQLS